MLEIEEVVPERESESESHLGEGFAEADARSTEEWRESEGAALATIRFFVPLASGVKAVWLEERGLLPLLEVVVRVLHAKPECFVLAHLNVANLHILAHAASHRGADRCIHAHCLMIGKLDVLELVNGVHGHLAHDVVLDTLHKRINALT